jgi:UDP-glucose 4-epimerase
MPSKILITGVSGFIGRHAARFFNRRGAEVYGVDSNPEEGTPMGDLAGYARMRLPSEELGNLLGRVRPDLVLHCAGRASVPLSVKDPRTDFFNGPVLTWEVLDAIRLHAPECAFLFLSSAAVYGCPGNLPVAESCTPEPISPYGAHKRQSEMICADFSHLFGLRTASARVFSAYGPGLRRQVVWDLCHKAIAKGRIEAQGTGEESRDFLHVRDLCEGLAVLAERAPMMGEVYNFGSGEETSIRNLAELVVGALHLDCEIAFDGCVPKGTPLNWRADISAVKALGFLPKVGIVDGVRSYAKWCGMELGE